MHVRRHVRMTRTRAHARTSSVSQSISTSSVAGSHLISRSYSKKHLAGGRVGGEGGRAKTSRQASGRAGGAPAPPPPKGTSGAKCAGQQSGRGPVASSAASHSSMQ